MEESLRVIEEEAKKALEDVKDLKELSEFKSRFLGRKRGRLTRLIKEIRDLPSDERPRLGALINQLKDRLEKAYSECEARIERIERQRRYTAPVDLTLPGRRTRIGRRHPVSITIEKVVDIFLGLGFEVVEGPEVETDYYNFEALNFPPNHPARDMQDTLYLSRGLLLRTHTSPVQIRTMAKTSPPIRIIAPGKAYRRDSDISHTPMFHQVEGLMVDRNINFAHLKGVLTVFVRQFFGEDTKLRFRPSFFPFTEPSAEVDIRCVVCKGDGCRVCSHTGWLEILGSGMVAPNVFVNVNYDPEEYTGFAFGMGIERIAMLKYGIDDIRLFFENNLSFLKQFIY